MARVQAGETRLFAELVSRYQDRLIRFASSKLQQTQLAEELVQETFLAAFQARMTYSKEFAFSTWLWTILLNLSRSAGRKRHLQSEQHQLFAAQVSHQADHSDPHQLLVKQEQQVALHQQLALLSEPQADAIRLRFFGDLSFEEIALTMNCSISGAKRRVKNGLLNLADIINKETL